MIKEEGKFKWIEEGEGNPIILLHGLMGGIDNFGDMVTILRTENFSKGMGYYSDRWSEFLSTPH